VPPKAVSETANGAGLGQIVLVLQGGGALGAYQCGVFEALCEAGIAPDWVIGTSIGAMNAAIIAGNRPADRLPRLRQFWDELHHDSLTEAWRSLPWMGQGAANALTALRGVPAMFQPNPQAFWASLFTGMHLTPTTAGLYSVAPLARTLERLIDIEQLNRGGMRLTVGAANVRTAEMHYFDSRDVPLGIDHVLASGALPPAFPAVEIDGELYWDGGLVSNTPVEAVFDDHPRRSGLVFAVHVWSPAGPDPDTLQRVLARQKDLQYASRSTAQVVRQKQIHRLRHVITQLVSEIPAERRTSAQVQQLAAFGCVTRMHVVRLVAPPIAGEDSSKDIDFSRDGIAERWAAGLEHTRSVLKARPWEREVDPIEGFILHETEAGVLLRDS
jgi:NTE family protein